MLNVVVLPAPFGPMMPTISHSPSLMLTSRAAWRPPKRMERSRVSSTDIGGLHLLHVSVVQVEAMAGQPVLQRAKLLAEPAGCPDQGHDHDQGQEEQPEGASRERWPVPDLRLDDRHVH